MARGQQGDRLLSYLHISTNRDDAPEFYEGKVDLDGHVDNRQVVSIYSTYLSY